ncbi:MAG: hypothetical protein NTY48_04555 [Candidatus Diapherotrites archaeon]|nr:hypothetical protein [Candidatus Diapherotrites archaeon]
MTNKKFDLVASIRRSTIKQKVLEQVFEPKTPTDLKKVIGIHRESISRALLSLEKQGLVTCKNPNQPNFRYYQISKKGKKMLLQLNKK